MRNSARLTYTFLILASLTLNILGCQKRYKESRFLMNTIVEITAVGSDARCQQALDVAFQEIRRIDGLMNAYNEGSEISRVNEAAGQCAVQVSADTLEVVERSLDFARLTDGALDVTVAPLMELWGFGNGAKSVPQAIEIERKLSLVDYRKVILDKEHSAIKLASPGMKIDVSGIAKGYAVDRAIQVLKDAGIKSALVNAGGDIYAMGSPSWRKSWRIGIRHPRNNADLLGVLELRDKAVATSGDYENFFEVDGRRYCHIMDTSTGLPVQGVMSATVVADSAIEADALATALFPLGTDRGMSLMESLQDVDAVMIAGENEADMEILMSSGMKGKVQLRTD